MRLMEEIPMFRTAAPSPNFPADGDPAVRARLAAGLAWLRAGFVVYRQRRALLRLDDAMLKDLGLSRVDALQEGAKPFWRT
jgi:uncharacterized protein YjiS (DUF1127 family)